MIISKIALFPYWLALKLRNNLYDKGIKKSYRFDVPIVCIGNVTVGGTGKTPMAEYTIKSLKNDYRVAMLSYGYKRRSRGFHIVDLSKDTARDVGDEPIQVKRKFPDIIVAVDKKRKRGIESLMALPNPPQVIILDDALQHRQVIPDINVGLIDFSRPIFKDELMPLGGLRDLPQQIRRAQAIVISKTPDYVTNEQLSKVAKMNRVRENDNLFFTKIAYGSPIPIYEGIGDPRYKYSKEVILFTGIANEKPLKLYLYGSFDYIFCKKFSDHHYYNRRDVKLIGNLADIHPRALLLTTEKDAQRLIDNPAVPDELKVRMLYIPVKTEFLSNEEQYDFDRLILRAIEDRIKEIRERDEEKKKLDPGSNIPPESCGFDSGGRKKTTTTNVEMPVEVPSEETAGKETSVEENDTSLDPVEVESVPVGEVTVEVTGSVKSAEVKTEAEEEASKTAEAEDLPEVCRPTEVEVQSAEEQDAFQAEETPEPETESIEEAQEPAETEAQQTEETLKPEVKSKKETIESAETKAQQTKETQGLEAESAEEAQEPVETEAKPAAEAQAAMEHGTDEMKGNAPTLDEKAIFAQQLYEKIRARLNDEEEEDETLSPVEVYEGSENDEYMTSYTSYTNQNNFIYTDDEEYDLSEEDESMMPVEVVEDAKPVSPEPIVYNKEKQEEAKAEDAGADVVPAIVISNVVTDEKITPVFVATLQGPAMEKPTEDHPQQLARAISLRKTRSSRKKVVETPVENLLF